MNNSKSGFVYLWHDMKRNMFYVGCHWGAEDDGYICSSNRMRDAYKRRPQDFRRRIIQRLIDVPRAKLLGAEHKWLQLIREDELDNRYYNHTNHKFNHWTTSDDEYYKLTVSQRISLRTKEAMNTPEMKAKMEKVSYSKLRGTHQPKRLVEKRRQSCIDTWDKKGLGRHHKAKLTPFGSDEYRANMSKSIKAAYANGQLDKVEAGVIKKYGVRSYFSTAEFKDRHDRIMVDRYGVRNPLQNAEVLNHKMQTCNALRGVQRLKYLFDLESTVQKSIGCYGNIHNHDFWNELLISCGSGRKLVKKYGVTITRLRSWWGEIGYANPLNIWTHKEA